MDIISAIASINALVIAFFLYKRKEQKISIKILTVWSIAFAIHFSTPFFIERNLFFHEAFWGLILGVVITSHTPFLFVYTNSLTDKNFKLNLKNLWHFGFVLIYILSFTPLLLLGKEKHIELIYEKQNLTYQVFLPLITLLFCQVYFLIRTTIVLVKHQYSIKHEFSYEKAVDLAWIKRIVFGFATIIVLSFIAYAMVSANIISLYTMDYSIIVANMILFFYIAYFGYRQNAIQPIILEPIESHKKVYKESKSTPITNSQIPVSKENLDPILEKLMKVMNDQKIYLEPELNIGNIANQLNVHAHQLSKLINNQLGKNFFEFVNEYRVEEFKKLVVDPKNKHISILGLAYDAGFNSKATFNRFFKNATGLTPSEFRESYTY